MEVRTYARFLQRRYPVPCPRNTEHLFSHDNLREIYQFLKIRKKLTKFVCFEMNHSLGVSILTEQCLIFFFTILIILSRSKSFLTNFSLRNRISYFVLLLLKRTLRTILWLIVSVVDKIFVTFRYKIKLISIAHRIYYFLSTKRNCRK